VNKWQGKIACTIKTMKKKLIPILVFLLAIAAAGQAPTHYPSTGTEPVEFDLANVILYIAVPAIILVVYLWWRIKKAKQ
jgi:hypothetical protein